jgi:hypothetical protein
MTDQQRLEAIFTRLGDIERNSATAHAQIQGGIDVLSERVSGLSEKVAIQNGRVTKAEHRIGELETKARIAERDIADDGTRHDVVPGSSPWARSSGTSSNRKEEGSDSESAGRGYGRPLRRRAREASGQQRRRRRADHQVGALLVYALRALVRHGLQCVAARGGRDRREPPGHG